MKSHSHFAPQPSGLGDVFGQEAAITKVREFIRARRRAHESIEDTNVIATKKALLLSGPAGVGKTMIARIVACIFLCENSKETQPCGICKVCRGFQDTPPRRVHDYREIDATERSGVSSMSELASFMRIAALGYRVVFIDEAHALTPAAFDALLKVTEEPDFQSIFVFATTREQRIPETLRSRCRVVQLREARQSDQFRFLVAKCVADNRDLAVCRESALARIICAASRNYRSLSDEFDRVVSLIGPGQLTANAVREVQPPHDFDWCICCFEFILSGDIVSAIECRQEWVADWEVQAAALSSFLQQLSLIELRGGAIVNSPLSILSPERRQALIERFRNWHAKSKTDKTLAAFVEDCARLVSRSDMQLSLDLCLTEISDMAAGRLEDKAFVPRSVLPPVPESRRRRANFCVGHKAAPNGDPPERGARYLELSQVEAICRAASFMGQAYGKLFNLHLIFHYKGANHAQGVCTITDFTRRVHQFVARRGQNILPYIYVHEACTNGKLLTRLSCQIDSDLVGPVLHWANTKFRLSKAGCKTTFSHVDANNSRKRCEKIAFHRRCVLQLLRGVNPAHMTRDEAGRLVPLADAIGVPDRYRHSLGLIKCAQRFGASDAIGPQRQEMFSRDLPLLSAFDDGAWSWLLRGWELDEYGHRLSVLEGLQEERRRIDALWPMCENTVIQAARVAALNVWETRRLRASHLRARKWLGWWKQLAERSSAPLNLASSAQHEMMPTRNMHRWSIVSAEYSGAGRWIEEPRHCDGQYMRGAPNNG